MSYKYSRYTLFRMIKACQKTEDGHYWTAFMPDLLLVEGRVKDSEYFYSREMFAKKMYFTERDVDIFMSKEALDVDELEFAQVSEKFFETNKDIGNLDVTMKLYQESFTVGELIDCFVFKYSY